MWPWTSAHDSLTEISKQVKTIWIIEESAADVFMITSKTEEKNTHTHTTLASYTQFGLSYGFVVCVRGL